MYAENQKTKVSACSASNILAFRRNNNLDSFVSDGMAPSFSDLEKHQDFTIFVNDFPFLKTDSKWLITSLTKQMFVDVAQLESWEHLWPPRCVMRHSIFNIPHLYDKISSHIELCPQSQHTTLHAHSCSEARHNAQCCVWLQEASMTFPPSLPPHDLILGHSGKNAVQFTGVSI